MQRTQAAQVIVFQPAFTLRAQRGLSADKRRLSQNLKKSWHPSTLRNIERVWKAEQMRDQERAKIEQLQKELEEERSKQEMRQYAENKGVVK